MTVRDASDARFRPHGKVFGTTDSGLRQTCSGAVVASANKSLVWTAAHCIFRNGESLTNLAFAPGYQESEQPFGLWFAEKVWVPDRWVEEDEDPFAGVDYAILQVAPNDSGELLENVVGSFGIAFNQEPNQVAQSFGYPYLPNPPYDGEHLQQCESRGSWRILSPLIAAGCNMKGGSSGGGWLISDHFIYSNTSFGLPTIPDVAFGPYLDDSAKALYDLAQGGAPPSPVPTPTTAPEGYKKHKMRLTLNLKRHLIAVGVLESVDGHRGCAYLAPIRVMRFKVDSEGRRVILEYSKTTFSRSDGTYRVRLADRPGRYFAVASEGRYDLRNDCAKAKSEALRHRRPS